METIFTKSPLQHASEKIEIFLILSKESYLLGEVNVFIATPDMVIVGLNLFIPQLMEQTITLAQCIATMILNVVIMYIMVQVVTQETVLRLHKLYQTKDMEWCTINMVSLKNFTSYFLKLIKYNQSQVNIQFC